MCWTRAAIIAIGISASGFAVAQTPPAATRLSACDVSSSAARSLKFDDEAPFAGASISYALARDCASILLYRLMPRHAVRPIPDGVSPIEHRRNALPDKRPRTGAPHFYARVTRKAGYPDGPDPTPLWADQKTCPALLPTVEALEKALAPRFTGDGPARDGSIGGTVDGAVVNVWAAGTVYPLNNESHRVDISYRTNLGTPTADWVEAALKQLAPCLSDVQPTPDPPIP